MGKNQILGNEGDLAQAVAALIEIEPRFQAVIGTHGLPPLRRAEANLEALLRIITDQLISLKAGAAIWARLESHLAPFDPAFVAAAGEDRLMSLGLSRAKARSFIAVAEAVASGQLDFAKLAQMDAESATKSLTALRGIGPWTADIFLLSGLGHADAWPAGDLALQAPAHDLLKLSKRPGHREMTDLAQGWRPHRAAAARLLWSHYRGLKGMGQAVT